MANKPNIRFKGFTEDWEQRKLGDVCERVTRKNKNNESDLPLTIASQYGLIDQRDFFNKVVAAKDMSNYYLLKKGEFAYNKSYSKGFDYGSIKRLNAYEQGCLSTLYICFGITSDDVESDYLECFFDTLKWYSDITMICAEGARNHGLLNVDTKAFFDEVTISMPSLKKEQRIISAYLNNLDNLITLHQRKCDDTKKLKKYMLQKMFPKNGEKKPEIRFAGFTDDWEQRKLGDVVIDHNAGIYISKEDYGKGTNVIGVGNIYDSDIFDGEIYRLGPVNDDKFILEENDIIYGESSLVPEGIARTVCIGKNGAGSAFAWHTRRVKLDKNVVNSHVATLELNYLHDIRKYLVSVSTQTALTGMTTDGYFGATLTLPSIQEQQKISDYFKQLDHLITLHQRKCDDLKNLKKYMLQNMFV